MAIFRVIFATNYLQLRRVLCRSPGRTKSRQRRGEVWRLSLEVDEVEMSLKSENDRQCLRVSVELSPRVLWVYRVRQKQPQLAATHGNNVSSQQECFRTA